MWPVTARDVSVEAGRSYDNLQSMKADKGVDPNDHSLIVIRDRNYT